jgi:dolichyl-phosphate-mannose--protein O-mannosyl transferase
LIEVQLQHILTGKWLTSIEGLLYSHPNTSNQTFVGCGDVVEDNPNCIWLLERTVPASMKSSDLTTLRNGERVRLIHKDSRQFLHSHANIPSPITHQQEVTCYWVDDDDNNLWKVELLNNKEHECCTHQESNPNVVSIKLFHILSKQYLHSHGGWEDTNLTFGLQEVTCWPFQDDKNSEWNIIKVHKT